MQLRLRLIFNHAGSYWPKRGVNLGTPVKHFNKHVKND